MLVKIMSGSACPLPIAYLQINNNQEYTISSSIQTVSTGDKRYLKLTGGILSGLLMVMSPQINLTGTGSPDTIINYKLDAYDTVNNYLKMNI